VKEEEEEATPEPYNEKNSGTIVHKGHDMP
jgi:hypothetical protein